MNRLESSPRASRSRATRCGILLGLATAALLGRPLAAADPVGQILGKAATPGALPYMLYLPNSYNTDLQASFPLVICLGGVSEVGDGSFDGTLNESATNQLAYVLHNGPLHLIRSGTTYFSDNPTIVVHPENPNNNYSHLTIDATITQVSTAYRVDPDRIYVTGYSQGGGGAWLYGLNHATRLAALVPIAGASYPSSTATGNMANLVVWALHDSMDPTVPPAWTTGTTTGFTPALAGWVTGIATAQGGLASKRCLDTDPDPVSFTVSGTPASPVQITGVSATRSAHYNTTTGWGWNDGAVFVGGDRLQVTIFNSNQHNGWDATYGTGAGTAFNRLFWDWLLAQKRGTTPVAQGNPEIIVDNADTAHTTAVGPWPVSTATGSYLGGYAAANGGSTFTFRPTLPDTAPYQVYIWYSGASGVTLSSVVPVTITANGISTSLTIDQQYGSGHWVPLGIYACGSGTGTTVTIGITGANGIVSADAVRFVELPGASPNSPPSISHISDQNLVASSTVVPSFTIGDTLTTAASLTVQVASDNATLLPSSGLVLGGSGGSRTVVVSPATGMVGSGHVILTVTDGGGLATTTSFTVTVSAPTGNTAPTMTAITSQTLALGGHSAALPFTIGDAESATTTLVMSATSSNTAYLPDAGLVLGGSLANRTITVTPASAAAGTATVTVVVVDPGGLAASRSFTVTTPNPNNPPTISSLSALSIPLNGHSTPLDVTIGDIETPTSALTLSLASTNTTYIPLSGLVLGGSNANRTLTITPVTGRTGTADISITVTDGGGLTALTTFTVSTTPVAGPTISTISAVNITGGGPSFAIPFSVTDPDLTTLQLTASATPAGTLGSGDFAFTGTGGSRFLVITPAASDSGVFQIRVTVTDINLASAVTTFQATVSPASTGSITPPSTPASSGGGGGGGGCGLGSGAYALAGLFMLLLRAVGLRGSRRGH